MSSFTRNLIIISVFVAGCVFCASAIAGIQFLPSSSSSGNVRKKQGNSCVGYNLSQPKCNGQACSVGWTCQKCVNAGGSFYKCTPKKCDSEYTPGKLGCAPCQQYDYDGFAGNQICGKCTIINRCLESASGDEYTSFEYLNSVTISGKDINKHMETGYKLKN